VVQEKIINICGPTAVGKTRVGIELAKRFGGEIVSADSQQVWRDFDIGTAKPSRQEMAEVRHHLVGVAEPTEIFDAGRFMELAGGAIEEITGGGRNPLVVGGTGMYIRMLLHGVCDTPPRDEEFRAELGREIEEHGLPKMHARLAEVDPETAGRISENDRTRIERALEIYQLTGEPASKLRSDHGFCEQRYDALKIGLSIEREELYRRINERCERMVGKGLVEEVRRLLERYGPGVQPFKAVGYREMLAHVMGEIGLDEGVALMKRNSRRFAKRQMTWFRSDHGIRWFSPEDVEAISGEVEAFV
jgi:tRNA dimethylallyltransferase